MQVLLDAWTLDFQMNDQAFLHDCQIFPVIRRVMARERREAEIASIGRSPVAAAGGLARGTPVTAASVKLAPAADDEKKAAGDIDMSAESLCALVPPRVSATPLPMPAGAGAGSGSEVKAPMLLYSPIEITKGVKITVSSGQARLASMLDNSTETYWQSGANDNVQEWNRRQVGVWRLAFGVWISATPRVCFW